MCAICILLILPVVALAGVVNHGEGSTWLNLGATAKGGSGTASAGVTITASGFVVPPSCACTYLYDKVGGDGRLTEDVVLHSSYGDGTLIIPAGTLVLLNGDPIMRICMEVITPPAPPPGANVIGWAYNFFDYSLDGVIFDPPGTIAIGYDPAALDGVDPATLYIAYYDAGTGAWVGLPSFVDIVGHIVSATTTHFSPFGILGPLGGPPPTPPPGPAGVPPFPSVYAGMAAALATGVLAFIIRRKLHIGIIEGN